MEAAERETTINMSDADDKVHIWTAQRKVITRLRKHAAFTETDSGFHGGTEWATFEARAEDWSPASGAKRKVSLSPERRAELSERMRNLRSAR